ncbi:MAG: hypothetical protein AAF913_07320 [Pseudomonadota bacterium]
MQKCAVLVGIGLAVMTAGQASATFCLRAEAETFIDAPTTIVFETIVDVAAYPDWNPFILSVEPEGVDIAEEGASFDLIVAGPRGGQIRTPEQTTLVMAPATSADGGMISYAFAGRGARLLGFPERSQIVTPIGSDQTFYETSERFCGIGATFAFLFAQAGFDAQTAALRVEAERRASE